VFERAGGADQEIPISTMPCGAANRDEDERRQWDLVPNMADSSAEPPLQFSLQGLLVLIAALAVLLALPTFLSVGILGLLAFLSFLILLINPVVRLCEFAWGLFVRMIGKSEPSDEEWSIDGDMAPVESDAILDRNPPGG
jgi:hypothetical protein